LENLVACELMRQGMSLAYVKTPQGHEVDFLATAPDGSTQLIQVASDIAKTQTFEREIRALIGAAEDFPHTQKILISENQPPRGAVIPEEVKWLPAWRWLLHPA
jgi:predicted AAA+ superfamily ATPase